MLKLKRASGFRLDVSHATACILLHGALKWLGMYLLGRLMLYFGKGNNTKPDTVR